MARKPRKKSESDIYHILMRGINRQVIFEDEYDYGRFVQTLEKYKEQSGFDLYAYCLMSNHVHLLLKVGQEPLEQLMRRICGSYVYWYNAKYDRVGYLFQGRFKSEVVEDDSYFLTVLRYIHQNPVKAGIVKNTDQYKWSSMGEYMGEPKLIKTTFALKYFGLETEAARERFGEFCSAANDDRCLEAEIKKHSSDEEARELIRKVCRVESPVDLQGFDKVMRNNFLKELKENHHLSVRQIERLTGINRGVVLKA